MNPDPAEPREAHEARRTDDLLNRNAARRYDTPRQYEQDEGDDPVRPAGESAPKTKI